MTKQKLNKINTASMDGVTIGELEPISTSQIKDTDLLATETDLSTNSISISQVKELVSNAILSKSNNQLGSIIFHPAPAGYQNIPAETNGFGDAILVADGRELDKTAYIDLWNFIKVRKDKGIYGFNGETNKSFKIDELTDKITLPNLLSGDALYMGNYGLQNAIFPQHTITSGNIAPTTQPHQHQFDTMRVQQGGTGVEGIGYSFYYPKLYTTNTVVVINPFTVSSSNISNLPAGITVGTDLKVAGVKMIPCIVCKPTYNINAGGGSGGGVATQDLDMNLFKIINVGAPVNDSDAVRLVDLKVDNNKIVYKRDGVGSYNTLQVTLDDLYNRNDFVNSNFVKVDRTVLLTGTGTFNTKQVASMDDLKDTNIIVGSGVRVLVTLDTKLNEVDNGINNLQNQVNTNTTDIANINVNLLNKQQLLINIPILETRINSNLVQNVLLGTPTILGLTGYNVNDYITVTNNIIKLKNTSYKIVNLSGSVLANYVDANGNPVTTGTKYYQVFFRRPSTVTVAGTNANDILNSAFDIKTDSVSIADCEYTFSDTFSSGSNDPFNIDGFVFSISNSTNTNIQTVLSRTGYAKKSFIRIRLG